ncbi:hypothetical protein ACLBOM_24740 [Escherichia coli]
MATIPKAIDIVLVAVSEHIERFAALAREMAATETRESRRDELLRWHKLRSYRPPAAADFLAGAAIGMTSSN